MIPHEWDMSFEKYRGLPIVVTFRENEFPKQGQIF